MCKLVANMLDSRALENWVVEIITNGLRSTLCTELLQARDIQAATHIIGKAHQIKNAEKFTTPRRIHESGLHV